MPYCTRNGVKTYYEVSGEGYPFVLMHANPFDRRLFLYQVAHLSTHFKVINMIYAVMAIQTSRVSRLP